MRSLFDVQGALGKLYRAEILAGSGVGSEYCLGYAVSQIGNGF